MAPSVLGPLPSTTNWVIDLLAQLCASLVGCLGYCQMSNETTRKGQNPFDRYITKSEGPAVAAATPVFAEPITPEEEHPEEAVGELWERMQRAKGIAERQREYTQAALQPKQEAPERFEEPHNRTTLVREGVRPTTWKDYWTGRHLWMWMVTAIWIWVSIGAIRGNLVGGLVLSVLLFFPAVLVMRLPHFLGGVGPGRNSRSSSSAV